MLTEKATGVWKNPNEVDVEVDVLVEVVVKVDVLVEVVVKVDVIVEVAGVAA
jgi:hypothetical protein